MMSPKAITARPMKMPNARMSTQTGAARPIFDASAKVIVVLEDPVTMAEPFAGAVLWYPSDEMSHERMVTMTRPP